jgi:hypothetical protein
VNISHSQVTYADGSSYESSTGSGTIYPIWQHTFSNLNWVVAGGATYNFAVWGAVQNANQIPGDPFYGTWFTHMSNAGTGGNTQDGANDGYLLFCCRSSLAATGSPTAQNPSALTPPEFDKGADVNVLIDADPIATPEPATMSLLAVGLVGIAWRLRRR